MAQQAEAAAAAARAAPLATTARADSQQGARKRGSHSWPQPVSGTTQALPNGVRRRHRRQGSGRPELTTSDPEAAIRPWLVDQPGTGSAANAMSGAVIIPPLPTTTPLALLWRQRRSNDGDTQVRIPKIAD